MNLVDTFCDISEKQPDHPAVIGPGKDDMYSYRGLREAIESMAGQLKAAGIQPGTCVGLHFKSSPMYIILTYAIWRCGACVVPISF